MLARYGACAYIEALVGLRLSALLLRLQECWLLDGEMACLILSISDVICRAGGLDRLPLARDLAVWKGKDGGCCSPLSLPSLYDTTAGKRNVKVLSGGYYGKIGYFCGHIVPYNKGNKIQSIK